MTDPRIEAAARALFSTTEGEYTWDTLQVCYRNMWLKMAAKALAAADAAARVRVVPFPIPDDRMETAKNTLLCWKGGALSDDDAIGMIVCGLSAPPVNSDALGGRDG